MRYELQQVDEAWSVRQDGVELARFERQQDALADIAARMQDAPSGDAPAALSLNYASPRSAG